MVLDGAVGENRTRDLLIASQSHYAIKNVRHTVGLWKLRWRLKTIGTVAPDPGGSCTGSHYDWLAWHGTGL